MSYCYYYKNSTEVVDPPPPTPGVLSCTLRTTDLEFTVTHAVPVLAAACRNVRRGRRRNMTPESDRSVPAPPLSDSGTLGKVFDLLLTHGVKS